MTRSLFNNVFVRFGAGSQLLAPIKKFRHWNAIAWMLIVVATVGWGIFVWVFRNA